MRTDYRQGAYHEKIRNGFGSDSSDDSRAFSGRMQQQF